jgi:hypothetical protein
MKRSLAFGCLLLIAGCGKGALPDSGPDMPDEMSQARIFVERMKVMIKEELDALDRDTALARRSVGKDKITMESVIEDERRLLKQLQERKRATQIRIRELLAEGWRFEK